MRHMLFLICLALSFNVASSSLAKAQSTESEPVDEKDGSYIDSAKKGVNDLLNSESLQKGKEYGAKGLEKVQKVKERVLGKRTSRDNRAESHLSLFYVPFNYGLVIPAKTGFQGTYHLYQDLSIEGEYLSASYGVGVAGVDLVDFSEKVMCPKVRWYVANTFNLTLGLGQRSYKFSLGNDFLAQATDFNANLLPALEVSNEIITLGLGNRWQFDNGITIGIDWFELIATLGQGKIDDQLTVHMEEEKYRDRTKKVLKYLRYGPTFNAIKISLGYTF